MNKTSVKGWRGVAHEYIRDREPFTTGGALRGQDGAVWSFGQLPRAWEELYLSQRPRITYTVVSYCTPIAWHVEGEGWVIPDVKYSPTTSVHQGRCYLVPEPITRVLP